MAKMLHIEQNLFLRRSILGEIARCFPSGSMTVGRVLGRSAKRGALSQSAGPLSFVDLKMLRP
jgi:hypothetical protein